MLLASCSSQSQPIPRASNAEKLASAIELRSSDIPSGWISQPVTSQAQDNEAVLAHCMGILNPWTTDQMASTESAVFHKAEDQTNLATISATTEVVGSVANANARMNVLTDAGYPACKSRVARTAIDSSLGAELKKDDPDISIGPVAITVTANPSTAGERSYTVSETFAFYGSVPGQGPTTVDDIVTLRAADDIVNLQKGPVIVQINFVHGHEGAGPDPAFPMAIQDAVTSVMAARLAKGVAAP
jgi:hypothetical protein